MSFNREQGKLEGTNNGGGLLKNLRNEEIAWMGMKIWKGSFRSEGVGDVGEVLMESEGWRWCVKVL